MEEVIIRHLNNPRILEMPLVERNTCATCTKKGTCASRRSTPAPELEAPELSVEIDGFGRIMGAEKIEVPEVRQHEIKITRTGDITLNEKASDPFLEAAMDRFRHPERRVIKDKFGDIHLEEW